MHILPGRPTGKPDQMSPIRAAVPVLGFGGWAVFTATVLAGLFFGGKWLYSKWKQ